MMSSFNTFIFIRQVTWCRLALILIMLTSLLSPGIFTDMRAMAAPDEWKESTISDFEAGDAHHVVVGLWDPGDPNDDGDVELESKLDQENWGPSKAPDTPKIYGDNAVAQTFITR